jgi:hypothetical protein
VATVLTCCIGIVGNLLSILVLAQQSRVSVFNHLLLFLCLSDLVFLLTSLAMSPIAMEYHNLYPAELYHACECVCHVALASSIFLTASLSIERHQAVCVPHSYQSRMISTGHRTLLAYYVLPTIFLACLLNIPRFVNLLSVCNENNKLPYELLQILNYSNSYTRYKLSRFISVSALGPILQQNPTYLR